MENLSQCLFFNSAPYCGSLLTSIFGDLYHNQCPPGRKKMANKEHGWLEITITVWPKQFGLLNNFDIIHLTNNLDIKHLIYVQPKPVDGFYPVEFIVIQGKHKILV